MRYFIGFLITIGLIVFILILLLSGNSPAPTTKLLNVENYAYNSNSTADLIIDGPIVADQNHRELRIDVTENAVTFSLYQGYQQTLLKTQSYPNNESSYAVFLHALQLNGFTLGINDKTLSDERGHCASGYRDIYSFSDGSTNLFRYWSTSCGTGTFKGLSSIPSLFQTQVPDYGTLTLGSGL